MRKFTCVVLLLLFFYSFPGRIFAEAKHFKVNALNSYVFNKTGLTTVVQNISIENSSQYYFTPTYSTQLGFETISNIKAYDAQGELPTRIKDTKDGSIITISFRNRVVGEGRVNEFTFSYQTPDIAKKRGNIWQIDIPGLVNPQEFDNFDVTLSVPKEFGTPSLIKPQNNVNSTSSIFSFSKDEIGTSGVYAVFGEAQFYNFNLSYYLSNSNLFPVTTEVALPTVTSYQEVVINSIVPAPSNVHQDMDGNWLAIFTLAPQTKLNIEVAGTAKLNVSPRHSLISDRDKREFLKEDEFWEVHDPQIQKIAAELKTPRAIYTYVVKKLTYNYDRLLTDKKADSFFGASKQTSVNRIGARGVLSNPRDAVCLEFSDLFITLARAAGIPARAVEGFAYTQDSRLRPLSFAQDVLHVWPEYYDSEKKAWIMVDPTWGNTTKGIDYYNLFDLDHLAFVIKGESGKYPIPPGGYKKDANSKDIHVSFAKASDFLPQTSYQIEYNLPTFIFSGFPVNGTVTVFNKGTGVLPMQKIYVRSNLADGNSIYETTPIPPFGQKTFQISAGRSAFLTNSIMPVTIQFGTYKTQTRVNIGILPQNSIYIMIGGVLFGLGITITIVALKLRRVSI